MITDPVAGDRKTKPKQPSIARVFKEKKKKDQKYKQSYSLGALHKLLTSTEFLNAHGAEADCFALMRVTSVFHAQFLDYVSKNSRKCIQ